MKVTRVERGWAGHYCCAKDCLFRRNTLLECGNVRIVVSTVGLHDPPNDVKKILGEEGFQEIGYRRYYETMAFHARRAQDRYWDANVQRQVSFDSPWSIAEIDADDHANDMHEAVVAEIAARLEAGDMFSTEKEELTDA